MKELRVCFVSALVILPQIFLSTASLTASDLPSLVATKSAQDASSGGPDRSWLSDFLHRMGTECETPSPDDSMTDSTTSMAEQFIESGKGLMSQAGELIGQRVGWLRPTTLKELALVWLAFAMALPWGSVSWLRPLLKGDGVMIRMVVVGAWTGIALWSGWRIWGNASGAETFASTMLVGVPFLLGYFNSVARSVGQLEHV